MSVLPVTEAKRTVLAHDQAIPLFHCSTFERTVVIAIVPLLWGHPSKRHLQHTVSHQSADPLISSKQKTITTELLW